MFLQNFKMGSIYNNIVNNTNLVVIDKKVGFTLAEVLITLGIIGVVAALTIPVVISNYRRYVVGTRLKHFYATIQVATRQAEYNWGDKDGWDDLYHSYSDTWFEKYLLPEMAGITSIKPKGFPYYVRYMNNGSAFIWDANSISFFPYGKDVEKCKPVTNVLNECLGKKTFQFLYYIDTGMVAFDYPNHSKNYTPEVWIKLINNEQLCTKEPIHQVYGLNSRSYCLKLIQLNNWKVPSDYPLKI